MRRHTYRILAATTSALAITGMLAAPAAWARDTTGPDSDECVQATRTVTGLQAQVETFIAGPPGTPSLVDLQAAVELAVAADNKADPPLTADSAITVAAKEALTARESLIAGTRTELEAATTAQTEACAEPGEVDPTPTPEPTTPAPTPVPDVETPDVDVPGSDIPSPDPSGAPTTTDTGNGGGIYFENCAAVRAAGAVPLAVTSPGYREGLDANNNGIACEDPITYDGPGTFSQTGEVPVGSAETGAA